MARQRICALVSLLLILVAAPPSLAQNSWASFRGPEGTGVAVEGLPAGQGPLALELAWKKPLGSGYSGVSVSGDTLVTAFSDGERDVVVALDPATGVKHWRYDLAETYTGHDGSHDGPISTPAIADGRVFMLSPWGHLAALDLKSGEALWTVHLVDDLNCKKPFYGFGSSPLIVGETMLAQIRGEGGSVAGFDVATGELRWRVVEDRATQQSPMLAELVGRHQILAMGAKKLAGIDPTNGSVLWEIEHGGGAGDMGAATASPLVVGDDRILLKNDNDATVLIAVSSTEAGFTAEVVETSRGMTKSYSPPARAGDHVFGYTARFLSAVDSTSGELLWRSRDPGDGFLISIGNQLVVLAKTGSLHLGAASPEGWNETYRLDLFDDLAWTPPSYANGAVYVRSLGEIARVDLVRTETPIIAETDEMALPAALSAFAAEAEAGDPAPMLDEFFDDRELPLIDGEDVIFLWRGDAKDVAIAGDMIGMRREEPMRRLEGTDVWWWATKLDRRARISYLFYVDYIPTTDPSHDRTVESTVLGPDRNWRRDEGVEMSWFAMPDWPGTALAEARSTTSRDAKGRLESFDLQLQPPPPENHTSEPEGDEKPELVQHTFHAWLPPGYDEGSTRYPVVYVHNEFAREVGNWPATLDRVVGQTVEPLIVVFAKLPYMPNREKVLARQVLPAVEQRYRTMADRNHRANVGMGWDGFGASFFTFSNPELFGLLGVQSFYALEEPMEWLLGAIGDADASTLPLRIYFEWGRWDLISPHEEMNMRAFSRDTWQLFQDKGWKPLGGEVWDSTDFGSWRNRTAVMLESLFPLDGAEPSLEIWQTSAP